MIHVRPRHEHRERRDGEQHQRADRDPASRLDDAEIRPEGYHGHRTADRPNKPRSAKEYAEGKHCRAAWRKLAVVAPVHVDHVQDTVELRRWRRRLPEPATRKRLR